MSSPSPTTPATPVAPPPQTPAAVPPPVTPATPPPVIPPTPTTPVPPTATPPTPSTTPVPPPTVSPPVIPPTPTPPPESPPPPPPESPPPPPPVPTPVTPSPPPPTPTPTPVTPSPPPPTPTPTPTPTPVTPSPSPPPPTPTPTPTPVTPSPPPPTNVPASRPPPPSLKPSPPPPSPPPPTNAPASPAPPPSHLSLSPPPPQQSAGAPPSKSNSGTVVGVASAVGAVAVLGLVAALIFCYVSRRRRRRQRHPPAGTPADFFYDPRQPVTPLQQSHALSTTPSSTPPLMQSPWQSSGGGPSEAPLPAMSTGTFAYDELAAAADGFSEANLLGQGGFGHVYRGTVRGQPVAIKKLRAGSGQGHREFQAEVEIISRVHHKNLVSLVGYCIHGEQRLLVYEYVPNKTLEDHLHHGTGRPTLDWPRRWKIAVGSAKGLAYLHEDCHPKIIHRDIKAANILLDYNYEPKVADFGLAKCQEAEHTAAYSTRVMGTFGYLAPEYASSGKVSDRSDVFSFGVMLLELITGRKPILTSSDDQPETLVSWARPLLLKAVEEENYEELIDPELENNFDAYDMARLIACAAAAVRQTARSRPRMTQIVRYLEGDLSAEDLNAGMAPGQSAMHRSSGGGNTDEVRRLRKMAFGPGTGTTGTITEYASSELSEPTSEYGLNPSSEYSSSAADTAEMTDAQRTGIGRRADEGAGGETGTTERLMSRRTTVSRQAGRPGRGQ